MTSFTHFAVLIAGLAILASCGSGKPEETSSEAAMPAGESTSSTTDSPEDVELRLALEPSASDDLHASPTGISPMDVALGAPGPGLPTADAGKASEQNESAVPRVTISPDLPPGVPIPDIGKILGRDDLHLESVTVSPAAPGEGPIGPDGNVIDPHSLPLLGLEGSPQPQEASEPEEAQAPHPAARSAVKPLDPSEAPANFPKN